MSSPLALIFWYSVALDDGLVFFFFRKVSPRSATLHLTSAWAFSFLIAEAGINIGVTVVFTSVLVICGPGLVAVGSGEKKHK